MTTSKTAEVQPIRNEDNNEWLQVAPGERFKIRVSSAQTKGAYAILEIVADPHNGVPLHIHNKEEHFIVLEGTLDIAVGQRRWDAPAGTSVTVGRGVPHAWCIEHGSAHARGFFAWWNRWNVQSGRRRPRRRRDHGHYGPLLHTADRTAAARVSPFDLLSAEIQRPLSRSTSHEPNDICVPRHTAIARVMLKRCAWRARTVKGEQAMEMHSRQSLYEIHGISIQRRRRRSRLTVRLLVARILAFPTKVKRAIEAELAARHAIAELADMDDRMLRDVGIVRSEIESTVRKCRNGRRAGFLSDNGEST